MYKFPPKKISIWICDLHVILVYIYHDSHSGKSLRCFTRRDCRCGGVHCRHGTHLCPKRCRCRGESKRPDLGENSGKYCAYLEHIHKSSTYTIYIVYIYTRIQWFICKYRLGDFTQNGDVPHLTCKMMNQNSVICPSIAGGWCWLVICSSNHTDSVSIVYNRVTPQPLYHLCVHNLAQKC